MEVKVLYGKLLNQLLIKKPVNEEDEKLKNEQEGLIQEQNVLNAIQSRRLHRGESTFTHNSKGREPGRKTLGF